MAYKLLGMVVWRGAKWFLRRKYAAARHPKPVLAGGGLLLLVAAGIAVALGRRGGDADA
jgi:hypothetical protein